MFVLLQGDHRPKPIGRVLRVPSKVGFDFAAIFPKQSSHFAGVRASTRADPHGAQSPCLVGQGRTS